MAATIFLPPQTNIAVTSLRQASEKVRSLARRVYIMAHGPTPLDKEGRLHGQRVDASLSLAGRLAAKKAGKQLTGKKISKIYSSPLKRAKETADILSKAIGAPIEVRSELLPWDIGRMSGAKAASVKPVLDFFSKRPNRAIPGGEAKADVLKRYKGFVDTLRKGKDPVAISGHSQHTLGLEYATKGGNAADVQMIGGNPGEVKAIVL
jgi:broad specificity phosphatase PhoE